jgi:hypothetical protein
MELPLEVPGQNLFSCLQLLEAASIIQFMPTPMFKANNGQVFLILHHCGLTLLPSLFLGKEHCDYM